MVLLSIKYLSNPHNSQQGHLSKVMQFLRGESDIRAVLSHPPRVGPVKARRPEAWIALVKDVRTQSTEANAEHHAVSRPGPSSA